ncbi:MAG: hypothetical protein JF606_27945, partial [Burkholderiales bacterium]|nr:hypothetical protein [Burkholderiales bacterium]
MERTGGRALQHQRQALPVLQSDSPPTPKQVQYATDIGELIPLILEVKAGAVPWSISQRPGMSTFGNAFNRNGTLKQASEDPHARTIHNKLNAIRKTHPDLVDEFELTLKKPSSRLPPLEQAASELRALIPLIREVKHGRAKVAEVMGGFSAAFKPDGTLKLPSANSTAQSIHNKLRDIRQSHLEVVEEFEAALKETSSRLPPLEQAASDLRDLIPLILEVKDFQATPRAISRRPGMSSSFATSFNPEGILKKGSANGNAQAIRNKLNAIRQTHWALFRQFTATTNMPRTSKNSPASTDADPKQMLVSGGLMRASTEFAKAGSSMADMARAAGLSEEAFHPFFTEFGPTEQGWALLSRLSPSIQEEVRQNIEFGCDKRNEEATRLKAVLNLLRGCTFDEIDPVVEGVTVSDFFRPGSVTARGRDFLLSLEEDQRSTYTSVLNLPVDWASPDPQASAQSPLPIHIPGQERASSGIIPSTPGDEAMGPPVPLLPEASLSVTLPGPQWPGWALFDPGTPSEVTGPRRPPQPAASGNVFDEPGSQWSGWA